MQRDQPQAGTIKDSHWRVIALPPGLAYDAEIGFVDAAGERHETVVCRDELVSFSVSVANYAQQQLNALARKVDAFEWLGIPMPDRLWPSHERVAAKIAFRYRGTPITQIHAYVRSGQRIGCVCWTFPHAADHVEASFWPIADCLMLNPNAAPI